MAAAGKGFVLVTSGQVGVGAEAAALFRVFLETVRELGGWLVEDGVLGATEVGFARLMEPSVPR